MKTINSISAYTLEVKKSKFHSFLIPFSEFETKLNELKNLHPKARHFVTAFRYYNEYNQIVEGSSDDGEPKGTSGRPTLKVLQGHDLINVAIITIRYFGGTLLGAGGLVRAYSDSANMAVANANLIEFEELIEENINVDYELASKCEYLFKKYNITVIDRNFLDGITYKIQGNKQNLKELRDVLFNQ
jgi:uncharacterized YigZ family protein